MCDSLREVPQTNDCTSPTGFESALAGEAPSTRRHLFGKFVVAALGAVPWVGGLIAAVAEIPGERAAAKEDDLRTQWLKEHQRKLEMLGRDLRQITMRFESFGADVNERIQSPEYLSLVRQAFRTWDRSETEEKRQFVANLVANCAGTRICGDDIVRLFIAWLDAYHEAHFAIIRELSHNPGSTRFDIWTELYGETPREDSAEADLYRMLIRDLSTGGVIRQIRDTTEAGQFLKRRPAHRRARAPSTMESAFEDEKEYVLTALGKKFVHYTLMGDIRRLAENPQAEARDAGPVKD